MKFLKLAIVTTICLTVIFSACKKADVYTDKQSAGSLVDSSGECLPKVLAGVYKEVTPLAIENYIDVHVMVDTVGAFSIQTDSVNGYYFKGTGTFGNLGDNRVRLYGHGSPDYPGTDIFTVIYGSTFCSVAVKVLPVPHADFILDTTAGGCPGTKVEGTLSTDIKATPANKAKLAVVVTKLGVYNIKIDAQNGISYQAKGTFTTLGTQTIDFIASGTPIFEGDYNYKAEVSGTSCIFSVHVAKGAVVPPPATTAVFTLGGASGMCTGASPAGSYIVGTALTSANTLSVQVNVTAIGAYSISTNAINGISFSGSGTFTTTGVQTVTLTGSGTPNAAGANNYTISGGGNNCVVAISVSAVSIPFGISGYFDGTYVTFNVSASASNYPDRGTPPSHAEGLAAGGFNATGSSYPQLAFGVGRVGEGLAVAGTYLSSNSSMGFNYVDAANDSWSIDYTKTFTMTITDITNLHVEGTFSGTIKKSLTSTTIQVTNGLFSVPIY